MVSLLFGHLSNWHMGSEDTSYQLWDTDVWRDTLLKELFLIFFSCDITIILALV